MPDQDHPAGGSPEKRPAAPRWGVRTLWWLALVFVSMLTANGLYALDVDYWGLLPLAGTVVGICGAAWCSIRGLASATWPGR